MAKRTIRLKGYGVQGEAVANAALKPGHLIELMSTGKVQKHANAGYDAVPMFAIEDNLQGKGIDDEYAASSIVQYVVLKSGDEVLGWLKNGETIVKGDMLVSDGAGQFQKHIVESAATTEQNVVAMALEAVDMSDSSGADPSGRIAVMIL